MLEGEGLGGVGLTGVALDEDPVGTVEAAVGMLGMRGGFHCWDSAL